MIMNFFVWTRVQFPPSPIKNKEKKNMNMLDIIRKKKYKKEIKKEDFFFMIDEYVKNKIPDYQMSAFLMASFLNNLNEEETFNLTEAMIKSGKQISFEEIDNSLLIDKHSTGGIGDKISIPLVPIMASLGLIIPMMSGRGLGHTGGTLDKLESISNFNTQIDIENVKKQIYKIGCCFFSQTEEIVPADKKLYILRNSTETIESIPLIASSIMSKKIAEGIRGLILDVKYGNGAFLENINDSLKLANEMIKIGNKYKLKTTAFITNMDQPLGNYIGNSLEILESIQILKNKGPKDILQLIIEFGTEMMIISKKNNNKEEIKKQINKNIENGKALEKFEEIIHFQKGNPKIIENENLLNISKNKIIIESKKKGFITNIDSKKIGNLVKNLGGGRNKINDIIDNSVGIKIFKKIGEQINEKEPICEIYYNNKKNDISYIQKIIIESFDIRDFYDNNYILIYKKIENLNN